MSVREHSMADAVEIIGVSDDTIRKYIKSGRTAELGIVSVRGGQGRGVSGAYWLTIDTERIPAATPGRNARPQRASAEDAGLLLEVTRLKVEVAYLRAERDRLAEWHERMIELLQTKLPSA